MGLCADPVSMSLHTDDRLSLDRPWESRLGAGGGGPKGLFTPAKKKSEINYEQSHFYSFSNFCALLVSFKFSKFFGSTFLFF